MINAFSLFSKIIQENNYSMTTYDYLNNQVKPPYDISDLLRWQWTQSVSALDKLIHDLVKIGLTQEYLNTRQRTDRFLGFSVPMVIHTKIELETNISLKVLIYQQFITERLSCESYQDPNKIAEALSFIWDEPHKWQKISAEINMSETDTKTKLKSIIVRRNQIVHAGDYIDVSQPKQDINKSDVDDVCKFIFKLGEAIFNLVK